MDYHYILTLMINDYSNLIIAKIPNHVLRLTAFPRFHLTMEAMLL